MALRLFIIRFGRFANYKKWQLFIIFLGVIEICSIFCALFLDIPHFKGYANLAVIIYIIPAVICTYLVDRYELDGVTTITSEIIGKMIPGYVITFEDGEEWLSLSSSHNYAGEDYCLFVVVNEAKGVITDRFKVASMNSKGEFVKCIDLKTIDALAPLFLKDAKRQCGKDNEVIVIPLEKTFAAIHREITSQQ